MNSIARNYQMSSIDLSSYIRMCLQSGDTPSLEDWIAIETMCMTAEEAKPFEAQMTELWNILIGT